MRKPGVLIVKCALFLALLVFEAMPLALAQPKQTGVEANRIVLGQLTNGAEVAFIAGRLGRLGNRDLRFSCPARNATEASANRGLSRRRQRERACRGLSVAAERNRSIVATAKLEGGGKASFAVDDRWKISGDVVSLSRKVSVIGAEQNAGFFSAIRFITPPAVAWSDVEYLAPGLLYGDPSHDGDSSPGGRLELPRQTLRDTRRLDVSASVCALIS